MDFRFTTNMDSKFRRENSCIKLFSQRVADVDEVQIYYDTGSGWTGQHTLYIQVPGEG